MDPTIWGPYMWFSLHSVTFAYPFKPTKEQAEKMEIFFNNLEYVIPCKICRINLSKNMRKHPIKNNLNSRKQLVFWLIDIHNMVNFENNKKILSYEEVIQIYEKIYKKKIILDGIDNNEILDNEKYERNIIRNNFDKKKWHYNNKYIYILIVIVFLVLLIFIIFVFKSPLTKKLLSKK